MHKARQANEFRESRKTYFRAMQVTDHVNPRDRLAWDLTQKL
jgi:hypothetical protein